MTSRWWLGAEPAPVWALLGDTRHWPQWWCCVRATARPAARALPLWRQPHSLELHWRRPCWSDALWPVSCHWDPDQAWVDLATARAVGQRWTWLLEPARPQGSHLTLRWAWVLPNGWFGRQRQLGQAWVAWHHFRAMRATAWQLARQLGCAHSTVQAWSGGSRG